ncbi:hypothetical protein ATK30_6334 [Amycolatopsis echigonensis]|uniref:Uncharacterized protein n=1 Tax=Amycolatopsis echigonensis TaxID=2576905 RepID=A0A2N3WNH3_9PSEU|nr:hypothetical protein ATK30_6334 [Amycolatopsis niigatensis]
MALRRGLGKTFGADRRTRSAPALARGRTATPWPASLRRPSNRLARYG